MLGMGDRGGIVDSTDGARRVRDAEGCVGSGEKKSWNSNHPVHARPLLGGNAFGSGPAYGRTQRACR